MLSKKHETLIEELLTAYEPRIKAGIEKMLIHPSVFAVEDDKVYARVKCYGCGFGGRVPTRKTVTCPCCGAELEGPGQHSYTYNFLEETADGFVLLTAVATSHYDLKDMRTDTEITNIMHFDGSNMLSFLNVGAGLWSKRIPENNGYYWYNDKRTIACNLNADEQKEFKLKFKTIFSKIESHFYFGRSSSSPSSIFEERGLPYKVYCGYKNAVDRGEIKKTTKPKKTVVVPEVDVPVIRSSEIEKMYPESTEISVNKEGLIYVAECKSCHFKFPVENSYGSVTECPHCGKPKKVDRIQSYAAASNVDEDGNIQITVFEYMLIAQPSAFGYKYKLNKLTAKAAIYANENGIYFYEADKEKLEKAACSEMNYHFHAFSPKSYWGGDKKPCYIGGVRKFVEDIESSVLAKTGYVELCRYQTSADLSADFDDEDTLKILSANYLASINYLCLYNNCKSVEQLAKARMTNLMTDMVSKVSCPKYIKKKETTPNKILGITKAQFKEIRDANIGQKDFEIFLEILKRDPTATYTDCVRFLNNPYGNESLFAILDMGLPKINMKEIERYVESLDAYQCMAWVEGIRLWKDYLTMCSELKCDMNDRSVLFTTSLKLEHDRTVRKYNNIRNKVAIKNFEEAVKTYKHLEYENEDDDFMVVVPKSQEALYEEGRILHHCVGSYAKSVAEGRSTILFIRSKNAPDAPLCTIEVSRGRLVQARTKYNAPAYSVPGIKKFMHAWAKEKKIILSPR